MTPIKLGSYRSSVSEAFLYVRNRFPSLLYLLVMMLDHVSAVVSKTETSKHQTSKTHTSKLQTFLYQVIDWSEKNLFQLNGDKTKELTITFRHNSPKFPRALIDGLPIESVEKTKLLGVTINSSLTWNDHIEDLVKKAFRNLYFLVQLKRAQIPPKGLVAYYSACIRSTLDYACPLFHHALPKYLKARPRKGAKRGPVTYFSKGSLL